MSRVTPTSNLFPSSAVAVSASGEQWLNVKKRVARTKASGFLLWLFYFIYFYEFIFITKVMDFIAPFSCMLCMTVGIHFCFDRI